MFKNASFLVAGGSGFVGTNLILKLLKLGANVKATLHSKPPQIEDSRIKWIKADLRNPEDCQQATSEVDYVFMCAANTSGAAVMEKTPLVHLTPNVLMNLLMLEAAYAAQVKKFFWISSNTVYPVTDHPVKEDEVNNTFYEKYFIVAWMKRFTEIVCEMYSNKIKNPMKVVVVRPANIYGPYDDFEWETSHVVPALIRKVVERHHPIEVWGDGKDIKDLIYIDDFIEGLLLAMEKIESFDPINIATGVPVSNRDVLNEAIHADGFHDAKITFNTSKPTMIPKRLIDTSKTKEVLGFNAKHSLKEGIKKTVDWYRQKTQEKRNFLVS